MKNIYKIEWLLLFRCDWHCASLSSLPSFFIARLIECRAAAHNEWEKQSDWDTTINNQLAFCVHAQFVVHIVRTGLHTAGHSVGSLDYSSLSGLLRVRWLIGRSVFQKLRKRERKWITVASERKKSGGEREKRWKIGTQPARLKFRNSHYQSAKHFEGFANSAACEHRRPYERVLPVKIPSAVGRCPSN